MGSLSRDASNVVRAGRAALQPTAADRERLAAAMAARLGPHAFPPPVPMKAPGHTLAWRVLGGTALGGCVVAGAVLVATPAGPSAPPQAPVSPAPHATISEALPPSAPNDAPTQRVEPRAPRADDVPARTNPSNVSAPRPDALTREVALLSRAVTALNAGRPAEALTTLNEHQRQFPKGALGADRQAAKAQALCSLGRVTEGRAQLAHLSPQSPAANRARQVCDSVSARK